MAIKQPAFGGANQRLMSIRAGIVLVTLGWLSTGTYEWRYRGQTRHRIFQIISKSLHVEFRWPIPTPTS